MEQKWRIKATLVDGVVVFGDYMTPSAWDKRMRPGQRQKEANDPRAPRLTLVAVNDAGEELPPDEQSEAQANQAVADINALDAPPTSPASP